MFRGLFRKKVPVVVPPYTVRRSTRARKVRLTVFPGGLAELTLPAWVSEAAGARFVAARAAWLVQTIEKMRKVPAFAPGFGEAKPALLPRRTRAHYLAHREAARALGDQKLAQWNAHYNFSYHRVAIRNSKSRWGSASARGNLNFNYRILFLPEHLQDYLIVHELCHLQQHNHSRNFWALVGQTIPDYKKSRKELHHYH